MAKPSPSALYLKATYLARIEDSVEAACDVFESALSSTRADAADEVARQTYAQFLLSLPIPPFARLVRHINQSVLFYPNNTLFLSLLVQLKRQGRDILNLVSQLDQTGDASIINGLWSTSAAPNASASASYLTESSRTNCMSRTVKLTPE